MSLKTDYVDDILDTSANTQRKYAMTTNADGSISLTDVTVYSQEGDSFGAADINSTNEIVNSLDTSVEGMNFRVVSALPSNPEQNTLYFIKEGN